MAAHVQLKPPSLNMHLRVTITPTYRSHTGRGKKNREVDIIAETGSRLIPFEIKYRSSEHTDLRALAGIKEFCLEKRFTMATLSLASFKISV